MAQIITFGTMKETGHSGCGQAMNMSYAEVDAIAKKILRPEMTIDKALEMNPSFEDMITTNSAHFIDTARALRKNLATPRPMLRSGHYKGKHR